MSEIKNCPFCNAVGSITMGRENGTMFDWVMCDGCDARGTPFERTDCSGDDAISAWNDRHENKRIAALEAKLGKLLRAYTMIFPGVAHVFNVDFALINEAEVEARAALENKED